MTLSTLDLVWAGMQAARDFDKVVTPTLVAGRPHSLFYLAGFPGAGVAPSAGLKGSVPAAGLAGCLPYTNAASGETKLAGFMGQMTGAGGCLLLCDRLWANSGMALTSGSANIIGNPIVSTSIANPTVVTCTGNVPFTNGDTVVIRGHTGSTPAIDGEYVINNVSTNTFTIPVNVSAGGSGGSVGIPFAARDDNGAKLGAGVQLGLEVSGATGVNAPTGAFVYTNSAGVTGRAGVQTDLYVASSAAGAFHRLALASGDVGVQTVQNFTFGGTAWASGTVHLVAYRVLAKGVMTAANVPFVMDPLMLGDKLYDGSNLFLIVIPAATTASIIAGYAQWSQG